MKDIIIKKFSDKVSDYLEAPANRDGSQEEKAAYCADHIYRQGKGLKDVELIDSSGYSARRCGGVLAQHIDDAVEEITINMEMSEEALAIMLENAYPQIVAYETDKAYKDSSETFDIDYWIDDAVGEIAAKKVGDYLDAFDPATVEYIQRVEDASDIVIDKDAVNSLIVLLKQQSLYSNLVMGIMDKSGVTTRIVGEDTFIPKAYDISTGENDAAQDTDNLQPELTDNGLYFNGTLSNLNLKATIREIINSGNTFTIAMRIYLYDVTTLQLMLSNHNSAGQRFSFGVVNGIMRFSQLGNDAVSVNVSVDTWYNVILTCDGLASLNMYLGTDEATGTQANSAHYAGTHSRIGSGNGAAYSKMSLRTALIFDKMLTESEISVVNGILLGV